VSGNDRVAWLMCVSLIGADDSQFDCSRGKKPTLGEQRVSIVVNRAGPAVITSLFHNFVDMSDDRLR
jgi:hypothetical protein